MAFPPLAFEKDTLKLLDQRLLPGREKWVSCRRAGQVHRAIRNMTVRGAPAIGVAGGYGLYLGIKDFRDSGSAKAFLEELGRVARYLKSARPTGVNLRNVIDRIVSRVCGAGERRTGVLKDLVLKEARWEHAEDDRLCRAIGRSGAALFKDGDRVLTHCNAGGLATTGYGTALGVLYAARESGKRIQVYADETRPLLQGARLTAWELVRSRIPVTVICDNMAASLMRAGKIDRVVVGADRIAANGDTANKIGTYNVAVLARAHGIPFYVAAPGTTFDFSISDGGRIPIEERDAGEIACGFGRRTVPRGARIFNPAFDVTPHSLVTAFFTEAGVLRPPFSKSFAKLKKAMSGK